MICDKNSVGADFGEGHVYPADRFRCPTCGAMILATNRNASFDPGYNFQDEYLGILEHLSKIIEEIPLCMEYETDARDQWPQRWQSLKAWLESNDKFSGGGF